MHYDESTSLGKVCLRDLERYSHRRDVTVIHPSSQFARAPAHAPTSCRRHWAPPPPQNTALARKGPTPLGFQTASTTPSPAKDRRVLTCGRSAPQPLSTGCSRGRCALASCPPADGESPKPNAVWQYTESTCRESRGCDRRTRGRNGGRKGRKRPRVTFVHRRLSASL